MIIDASVHVGSEFLSGLREALLIFERIERSSDTDNVLTFEEGAFATPLFLSALLARKFDPLASRRIELDVRSSYLCTICFDKGGISTEELGDIEEYLGSYRDKSYIPIMRFPLLGERSRAHVTSVGSAVVNLLRSRLDLSGRIFTGVNYLISEILDNVIEHSFSHGGGIICQDYARKGYMDICIFDNGVTIPGSYRRAKLLDDRSTDAQALQTTINRRLSTKNTAGSVNRGFGISSSRQMLVHGLQGEFLIFSGSALYVSTPREEKVFPLPNHLGLHGTIVGLRIPRFVDDFNPSDYYEL
ncbi:ATP-binding protein [Porphyromonas sp. HMSC065F10]|uniref:ATP-binding protein n=1 Tax=Porphyromonas sp. HMSC065F10 TaxID=1739394 RepID=UPI0008A52AEC|nr:ATP-binding protein [Porphyromonas sp. HMSC065F10]OFR34300.1 hypothetical protein HMPREF2890_06245 [Porphyromonas sp. HMSC065F10]